MKSKTVRTERAYTADSLMRRPTI